MYSIHVTSQQRLLRVTKGRLVRLAETTLDAEEVRRAEISLALVDDPRIHELNRQFLGHDYPTDVISFLLDSEGPPARPAARTKRLGEQRAAKKRAAQNNAGQKRAMQQPAPDRPRGAGKSLGGEIIISVETAIREAARYGWPPIHELSLYVVHGLLHLCGYDDLTPAEQRVMRSREVEALALSKIVPRYVVSSVRPEVREKGP
jgi:probable rRNA maturation factor